MYIREFSSWSSGDCRNGIVNAMWKMLKDMVIYQITISGAMLKFLGKKGDDGSPSIQGTGTRGC